MEGIKVNDKKHRIIWILAIIAWLLFAVFLTFSEAGERQIIKRYDNHWNLEGYSVREGNRETEYDRNWNRQGHRIYEDDRVEKYDDHWNREGEDENIDERRQQE